MRPPSAGAPSRPHALPEEHRDLRRSDPELRRLRRRIHPLGRRSGVLRPEGVRQRPEALHELPRQPASGPRRRLRRPRHRRPARLRARRRPPRPRVLRGRLLVVRQPGAGPVQSPAWTARSTARTASGRSAPTDGLGRGRPLGSGASANPASGSRLRAARRPSRPSGHPAQRVRPSRIGTSSASTTFLAAERSAIRPSRPSHR